MTTAERARDLPGRRRSACWAAAASGTASSTSTRRATRRSGAIGADAGERAFAQGRPHARRRRRRRALRHQLVRGAAPARGPRLLRRGRGRRLRPRDAASAWTAASRSTPTAACMSFSHIGWGGPTLKVVEAVRQLRGEAGATARSPAPRSRWSPARAPARSTTTASCWPADDSVMLRTDSPTKRLFDRTRDGGLRARRGDRWRHHGQRHRPARRDRGRRGVAPRRRRGAAARGARATIDDEPRPLRSQGALHRGAGRGASARASAHHRPGGRGRGRRRRDRGRAGGARAQARLWTESARLAPADALLGTNTSQLSITVDRGRRWATRPTASSGTHFFNPPVMMRLCELVAACSTSDREAVERARAFAASRRQTGRGLPQGQPGLHHQPRLRDRCALECMRMLEEGVASAEDIDTALKLGFNFPMGPLELGDMNGLDTFLHVADALAEAHGERFRPTVGLRNMVAAEPHRPEDRRGLLRLRRRGQQAARATWLTSTGRGPASAARRRARSKTTASPGSR